MVKKVGILGDIGSGKSYVAKNFGYPVFNADVEVGRLYKKDKKIFNKLKKKLPKYIFSFPVDKNEISKAILANTIKGKGFSFSENNNDWHHSVLSKTYYEKGLAELSKN